MKTTALLPVLMSLFAASLATAATAPERPFKNLPLPGMTEGTLSLGGQLRERYEYFNHSLWGAGPQDHNGFFLQRYMLNADLRLGGRFRVFTELKSGLINGRTGGPRPPDEDRLDLHQGFLDLVWADEPEFGVTVRAGRQELAFGSSRLVSFREGPNVRQSFDAVRALVTGAHWTADVFASAPVETNPGSFDDASESKQRLWGLYAVLPNPWVAGGKVDAYYLGFRQNDASFNQGPGREERHTVGTRLWGQGRGWDYNLELAYQFGNYGVGRISAWTAASDVGYTFATAAWKPRLGLKTNIASGDRDPTDANLQTFNPLFPRGAYFNDSGLIGPANIIDLHPSLDLRPHRSLLLTWDADFFWRESTADGVYGPAVNLLRSGQAGRSREIGTQVAAKAEWALAQQWKFNFVYSRFFAGEFIRQSGAGRDVDYVSSWVTFTF